MTPSQAASLGKMGSSLVALSLAEQAAVGSRALSCTQPHHLSANYFAVLQGGNLQDAGPYLPDKRAMHHTMDPVKRVA